MLIILPTLGKSKLVRLCLCDVVLFPSCLLEHTLTAVCVPLFFYCTFRSLASKAFPRGYSKSVCVSAWTQKTPNLQYFFSQMTPDEHPPTPPPSRCPALITLPTLAKFQLVWHRLCAVVPFPSSCLVPAHPCGRVSATHYQTGRNCNVYSFILWPSKCPLYFRPDLHRFEVRLQLHGANVAPRR